MLIALPFADTHNRYIILKSTIDSRLMADRAYDQAFVSRTEVARFAGNRLSRNYLVNLMSVGEAISSSSETTYSNITATNHGISKLSVIFPWNIFHSSVGDSIRALNWFFALFWYAGLPVLGAFFLRQEIVDHDTWYPYAFWVAFAFAARPLIVNGYLHISALRFTWAKSEAGI